MRDKRGDYEARFEDIGLLPLLAITRDNITPLLPPRLTWW